MKEEIKSIIENLKGIGYSLEEARKCAVTIYSAQLISKEVSLLSSDFEVVSTAIYATI